MSDNNYKQMNDSNVLKMLKLIKFIISMKYLKMLNVSCELSENKGSRVRDGHLQ